MDIQTILLIVLAGVVALVLVLFQYHYKTKKRGKLSVLLSFLRFLTWFGAFVLLINPKFTKNDYTLEKANLMVLADNSSSMKDQGLIESLQALKERQDLADKFNIIYHSFGGNLNVHDSLSFSEPNTNISKALKSLNTIYGGNNGAVLLLTDGNQTLGEDYEFYSKNQKMPVYPIILGDTTTYEDVRIDQVNTNKYAFLNNKFPLEAYVSYQGSGSASSTLSISVNGKSVYRENISFGGTNRTKVINTLLSADIVGTKRIQISLGKLEGERNTKNNSRTTAVEVIDEKTNIALVSDVLHPDIGSLKNAIETNEQRAVSILKSSVGSNKLEEFDLFILYQPKSSFKAVYDFIEQKKVNYFTIVGPKTNMNFLNSAQETFSHQRFNQTEETSPNLNPGFSAFDMSNFNVDDYPPLDANMGEVTIKKPGETLLSRRVRGVSLNDPLLYVSEADGQREGVLFGENIWKWRVQNYRNEKSFKNFDEFIGKLIRYLAASKPKTRFSLDYETVYEGTNSAKIKANYFDKAYEFDGNATIDLQLKHNDTGVLSRFTMLLKNGYFEADLANMAPGTYTFTAKVLNENLTKSGSFTILDFDVERQFLSTNYKKLERMALNTSAESYFPNQVGQLVDELMVQKRFLPVQKSEQNVVSLIDFRVLLALIAATLAIEWFIRKYNGLN